MYNVLWNRAQQFFCCVLFPFINHAYTYTYREHWCNFTYASVSCSEYSRARSLSIGRMLMQLMGTSQTKKSLLHNPTPKPERFEFQFHICIRRHRTHLTRIKHKSMDINIHVCAPTARRQPFSFSRAHEYQFAARADSITFAGTCRGANDVHNNNILAGAIHVDCAPAKSITPRYKPINANAPVPKEIFTELLAPHWRMHKHEYYVHSSSLRIQRESQLFGTSLVRARNETGSRRAPSAGCAPVLISHLHLGGRKSAVTRPTFVTQRGPCECACACVFACGRKQKGGFWDWWVFLRSVPLRPQHQKVG